MSTDRWDRLPRVDLAHLPTPLEEMPRLAQMLGGPSLWVKRDDQTGLAGGGNKARKLEFLVGEALEQGADWLITAGAAQSNHCRQTAAAAVRNGLKCTLVLRGSPPPEVTGNLLLDHLLGAQIRWAGDRSREEVMADVAEELREQGHRPYVIPIGGSNAVGAVGYALAMWELQDQLSALDAPIRHIFVSSSSGGTHAGLMAGAYLTGFEGVIHGISNDRSANTLRPCLAEIATQALQRLGVPHAFQSQDFVVHDEYLGEGYGVVTEEDVRAIRLVARTEGILLDPVYTARVMSALVDMVRRGEIHRDEGVLFWHTGGFPSLFAHTKVLL